MRKKAWGWLKRCFLVLFIFLVVGFCLPSSLLIPVEGATTDNWDYRSYWYYPWGKSITHKGIDIFASNHTNVISPTYGLVLSTGNSINGGNFIYLLGPRWRVHYFAHLDTISTATYRLVKKGEVLGKVGNTGNAAGKEPHLHYSISTLIPYPWLYDEFAREGWLKMIYLNPEDFF